jgi:hypothetical protein
LAQHDFLICRVAEEMFRQLNKNCHAPCDIDMEPEIELEYEPARRYLVALAASRDGFIILKSVCRRRLLELEPESENRFPAFARRASASETKPKKDRAPTKK